MSKVFVTVADRIISAITYITAGWGGLIFCVILYFAKRKMTDFVKFNIFQSIFISALYFCFAMAMGLIMKLLAYIPFINYVVAQISFMLNRPIFGDYSLIQTLIAALITYLTVFSLLGKYPKIYWISNIISHQLR